MKFQILFLVFLLFALAFASKVMEDEEFDFAEEEAEEGETYYSCDGHHAGRTHYRWKESCQMDCKKPGKSCQAH